MTEFGFGTELLEQAIRRLEEGLRRHVSDPGDLQLRDGLVHRFELTYDLCCKALKGHLQHAAPSPALIDRMPFQDHIGTAYERGLLLGAWPAWHGYRRMRGAASGNCDDAVAADVVASLPGFLEEAAFLRNRLRDGPVGCGSAA